MLLATVGAQVANLISRRVDLSNRKMTNVLTAKIGGTSIDFPNRNMTKVLSATVGAHITILTSKIAEFA